MSMRDDRNATMKYWQIEPLIKDATNNDTRSPTLDQLREILNITYDPVGCTGVMEALEEQLKDMSNWRQMSKALQIIEYCIQEGAERCAAWAVRRAQFLGSLRGSIILDKDGNDVGNRVRAAATRLFALMEEKGMVREDPPEAEQRHRTMFRSGVAAEPPPSRGDETANSRCSEEEILASNFDSKMELDSRFRNERMWDEPEISGALSKGPSTGDPSRLSGDRGMPIWGSTAAGLPWRHVRDLILGPRRPDARTLTRDPRWPVAGGRVQHQGKYVPAMPDEQAEGVLESDHLYFPASCTNSVHLLRETGDRTLSRRTHTPSAQAEQSERLPPDSYFRPSAERTDFEHLPQLYAGNRAWSQGRCLLDAPGGPAEQSERLPPSAHFCPQAKPRDLKQTSQQDTRDQARVQERYIPDRLEVLAKRSVRQQRSAPSPPPGNLSQRFGIHATRSAASLASSDTLNAGTKKLGDYFPEGGPLTPFTDIQCCEISGLLREAGQLSWSYIPRIYVILRLIRQLHILDDFIDQGINDLWLPFTSTSLPRALGISFHDCFLKTQQLVLTKAVNLENGQKGHAHFTRDDPFPFQAKEKLGEGGYGYVDKVVSPLSGREFARKRFRRGKTSKDGLQSFMNELQILKRICHIHCVELSWSYTDLKYFGIIMDPVADYNLSTFYSLAIPSKIDLLRTFFGCISNALYFLHSSKIRHRDIKPENILVKLPKVFLTDFGISLDWEDLSRSTTTKDTAKSWLYCAPEVARGEKRNSSADIWSLGCVFLEMFTIVKGRTISDLRCFFRNWGDSRRFYENIPAAGHWLAQLQPLYSSLGSDTAISDWVTLMLQEQPSARISAEQLYNMIATHHTRTGASAHSHYCGDCCVVDTFSVSDSGSDRDPLADSMRYGSQLGSPLSLESRMAAPRKPQFGVEAPRESCF